MSVETEKQRSNRTLTVVLGAVGIAAILACAYVVTRPAAPSPDEIAANAARQAAVQQQTADQSAVLTADAQAASAQRAAQQTAADAQLAAEAQKPQASTRPSDDSPDRADQARRSSDNELATPSGSVSPPTN